MMNISRADAMEMPLYEYEARLYHWNEAHGGEAELPDIDHTMRLIDKANLDPRLTN